MWGTGAHKGMAKTQGGLAIELRAVLEPTRAHLYARVLIRALSRGQGLL